MKFIRVFWLLVLIFPLTGCSALHKVLHKQSKVDKTTAQLNDTQDERLHKIGEFATATDLALQLDDKTNAVTVAKKTNDRVLNLSEKPTIEEFKAMQIMVAQLSTNNEALLIKQDYQINKLEKKIDELTEKLQKQTQESLQNAAKNAAVVDKMNKWFGLGAVFYGVGHFVTRMAWILGIGTVIFLGLRIAANFYPPAAAAFSIFDGIGALFVHGVQAVAPKAVQTAGYVAKPIENAFSKIVDTIQTAKIKQDASGKSVTLDDILADFEKNFGDTDKKTVDATKAQLGYKPS